MYCGRSATKGPSSPARLPQQPPQLLVVHAALPFWADVCSNLCEALQNFFSLACSLLGPSRMSLFSLYVVQNQHECLLPFVQVKGNFARLQRCVSELRLVQREGRFRRRGRALKQAVQDGLQQLQQYGRHAPARAALTCAALEITVLTSQPGKEVVQQLEDGLKDTDLGRVRRLQVVEVTNGVLECMSPASPLKEHSSDESSVLGIDIDLQTVDNNTVSMELVFKAWLHPGGTDQEHIHLLFPSGCFNSCSRAQDSPVCLKCDLQERLLSPSLLPGTADSALRMDDPKGDSSAIYQMVSQSSASPYKLQVVRALEFSGICQSLMYGLPFILRPTSCWQLEWDELEMNQQQFHALCHSLLVLGAKVGVVLPSLHILPPQGFPRSSSCGLSSRPQTGSVHRTASPVVLSRSSWPPKPQRMQEMLLKRAVLLLCQSSLPAEPTRGPLQLALSHLASLTTSSGEGLPASASDVLGAGSPSTPSIRVALRAVHTHHQCDPPGPIG